MRRATVLFVIFVLLASLVCAEETRLTLRTATSAEEVGQFLLLPTEEGPASVAQGYIRYIAQNQTRDPAFRKEYWLSGEEGAILDLTLKERYGYEFGFHAGVMCTRAAYSMALSCLGIDVTPGEMSAMTGARNLDEPYDMISELVGVERVTAQTQVFNTMLENYLTDDSYSPVYLYIRKPSGSYHALLIVAAIPDTGRYLVVDSSPYFVNNEPYRVYFISLNKRRSQIINSTFRQELAGSTVLQVYQWRLIEDESTADAAE